MILILITQEIQKKSSKQTSRCPGSFPKVLYICDMNIPMGFSDLRKFWLTFDYWKKIATLGEAFLITLKL